MNVKKLKDELAQMSDRGVVEVVIGEINIESSSDLISFKMNDKTWYDFEIDVSDNEHALIYLTKCVMG